MEERFRREEFERASPQQRTTLLRDLADLMKARMRAGPAFHRSCYELIEELREAGHDIWSFDESDDFQLWGPDYAKAIGRGLIIHFTSEGDVNVKWQDAPNPKEAPYPD